MNLFFLHMRLVSMNESFAEYSFPPPVLLKTCADVWNFKPTLMHPFDVKWELHQFYILCYFLQMIGWTQINII